ncbi:uncharacterized protein LOC122643398 [Telopea speciosissima]|uniref:uncharacterized protein LOC122643398 n=1 Tax=Telopea speciosissima TaxID=54955 RepID=UPI001CC72A6E|nr:uncharacterized protein LOC122643398 [Telopea speciosissima]
MAATNQTHTVTVPIYEASNNQNQSPPRIRRVPCILRHIDKNRGCYEPMLVSIGPFHHGRPDLQLLEPLKIELEQQFISDMGSEFPAFDRNFDEVAIRARECYDLIALQYFTDMGTLREITKDVFKSIMFRDGCFIRHFIHCMAADNPNPSDTKMKTDQRAFMVRDMFLLENQLPFIVLKELMSLELITKFIRRQMGIAENNSPPLQKDSTQPLHLLDLLRKELVRDAPPPMSQLRGGMELDSWYSFRTVTELKASSISCKRSTSHSLKGISFKTGFIKGHLLLPRMIIDDSTKSKFLNLVAYETCPDAPDDFTVTSYICLLDSLIDSAEDVKELRSKGILLNALGSDQQVADLFNDLTLELVPDSELYQDVKSGIERHYKSKVRIWMAEVCNTYFRTPWSIIAFVAAGLALLLTMAQTYYAANDSSKKP